MILVELQIVFSECKKAPNILTNQASIFGDVSHFHFSLIFVKNDLSEVLNSALFMAISSNHCRKIG